ncbi:MAG: hypothetical protein A2W25_10465 [candidate division Zixibacteria bacterium RBG_16_53_22]|nr:MAG: hypothetical protein A2W25_10465 [candidate division Zixibacteria bacterium RBG_16_53_22]
MKKQIQILIIALSVIVAFVMVADAQGGWRPLESGTDTYLFDVAFANDSIGIAIGSGTTIVRTIDGGQNWTLNFLDLEALNYSADMAEGGRGAIIIGGAIARTIDAGVTWNLIIDEIGGYFDIEFLDNNIAGAVGCNAISIPRLTLSTDGWSTYSDTAFYIEHEGNWHSGSFRGIGYADSNNICMAGIALDIASDMGAIVRSTDGGGSWSTVYWNWHLLLDIDFPSPATGYAVGTEGFIVKTTDGGANWDSLRSGVEVILWSLSLIDDMTGIVVGEGGKIIGTTDGGQTWISQESGTSVALRGVEMLSPNVAYVAGDSGTILYTENGGWPSEDCDYAVGDINGDGSANGIDVTYGVRYFKGGSAPPDSCDCPPLAFPFYAAGDVNGDCVFNGIDITYYVAYLKRLQPVLRYCADCPPLGYITNKIIKTIKRGDE